MSHIAYIALGSNQGNRQAYLERAIELMGKRLGDIECISTFIETEPDGFVSSFNFLNAVLILRTALEPLALLKGLQQIEYDLGRRQKSQFGVYHDRTIDLDILTYDDLQIQSQELTIPHPRMHERSFVLIPLDELKQHCN